MRIINATTNDNAYILSTVVFWSVLGVIEEGRSGLVPIRCQDGAIGSNIGFQGSDELR